MVERNGRAIESGPFRDLTTMSKHRVRTGLALLPLAGTSVAGMALLSGGMLPAGPTDPTRPEVRLTSVECQIGDPQIGDPLCAYPLASIGSSGSGSTLTAIATPSASATGGPFSFLVGNGTADSPNAGLLIGDGYSYTADDVGQTPLCVASKPCNGGNAGLLFGKGGNGYDGGSGGNAYFYGRGGNGGNAGDSGETGADIETGDRRRTKYRVSIRGVLIQASPMGL